MSLIVTLHVYSQRRDPSWLLSEEQVQELLGRVHSLRERTPLKARGIVSRLGYRGFSISLAPDSVFEEGLVNINEGIIDPGSTKMSLFDRDREIEAWLLGTAGDHVSEVVREHVRAALDRPAEEAIRARAENLLFTRLVPSCTPKAVDAPPFNPNIWNVFGVQSENNCYNYANDQMSNNFAQPGTTAGINVIPSCSGLQSAAETDGLVSQPGFTKKLGSGKGWYVALVFWPGNEKSPPDFHWYRQDASGCWSHKPGSDEVTNLDSSGNVITDPQTCDRGPYTHFCAYMVTNVCVRVGEL